MAKIKFERDKETGKVLVYKDGKLVGEIDSMGDEITGTASKKPEEKKPNK